MLRDYGCPTRNGAIIYKKYVSYYGLQIKKKYRGKGMGQLDYTKIIFAFIAGLGLFIYGMQIMGDGLQRSAGNRMKKLLEILTNNRFMGVLVGAGVTAVVQSSSATTVMTIGFVNAGLMSLTQAVGVIMGANIGTTVTGWIVASSEWSHFLKPTELAPIAIGIGVMMMFSKKKSVKQTGEIVAGFGILFFGLEMMSAAVKPLRSAPAFANAFMTLGVHPLWGILAGAAVTAIIQSSSASVGILQTLAAAALVPWNAAVYIIMGQNIGTCVTALLSSIGANKTAKRAAYIHLLFNIIGTVFFSILAIVYFKFINVPFGDNLINMTEIGTVHTVFNVLNTLILFPFPKLLIFMAEKLIKGKDDEEDEAGISHLDDRILETPTFALENAMKETVRMGYMAVDNVRVAQESLLEKNEEKVQKVFRREKIINAMERAITQYLVKISNSSINEQQHKIVTGLFHTINDIERVGDHAENIVELTQLAIEEKITFSTAAAFELKTMFEHCIECYEDSIRAREQDNPDLAKAVVAQEDVIDIMEEELRARHIARLSKNACSATAGIVFLDVISNLERIADHASNVALSVLDEHNLSKRSKQERAFKSQKLE